VKNQYIAAVTLAFSGVVAAGIAGAAEVPTSKPSASGFYGGVSLREQGTQAAGIAIGKLNSAWTKFTLPVAEDTGARSLTYGGYRWDNDVSVEAALGSTERYTLTPAAPGARRGVGLALSGETLGVPKSWNVDVYTGWSFHKDFALYGRLGYTQTEALPGFLPGFTTDIRRSRDGVNYGVGLRYDLSSALGLRLEYARFGRLPGDAVNGLLPENGQVQVGVQFRF
jgi:opacity protein-like surface antigen